MARTLTHAGVWKTQPTEKRKYVSSYIQPAFKILNKNSDIHKILDVACGNGMGVTLPLLRAGYDVYCFDHTKAATDAVRRNMKSEGFKANIKRASMYKSFPYKDDAFDATFCFQAIYHGRPEQVMFVLKEIRRVTRKGGGYFISFLPFEVLHYDKKAKRYFSKSYEDGKVVGLKYRLQDKKQQHVFYPIEIKRHLHPHYQMTRKEVQDTLNSIFKSVIVKRVKRPWDIDWFYWLAYGKVK